MVKYLSIYWYSTQAVLFEKVAVLVRIRHHVTMIFGQLTYFGVVSMVMMHKTM